MTQVTVGNRSSTVVKRTSPVSASQDEVDAGSVTNEYVSPSTLSKKDADVTALVSGATIALTAEKHSLSTALSAITFTNSFVGDVIVIEVTLSATSSTFTFPSGYLCKTDGTASGDNTCALSGTSGDKYVICILKIGSNYYVSANNLGQ